MGALYENLQGGSITNSPLTSGGTTINSSAFAALPTVVAPDFMFITLDPTGAHGAPEIVKVTAHTAAATFVTVVRAQQDTSAREHPVNTEWVHALTEADVDEFLKVVGTSNITDGAVTTPKIVDFGVTTAKLATSAVNTDKLGAGSVTEAKLADSAVAEGKIAAGAVTGTKLADGSVSTAKVVDSAVTAAKIGAAAVTEAKIADAAVTGAKVADGAVTTAKVANGAVTSEKLAADVVTGAKLADDAVDSEHLVDGSVDGVHLANGAVSTAKIVDDAVTRAKLAPDVDTQLSNLPTQYRVGRTAVTTDGSGDAVISFGFTFSATPSIVATVERTSTSQNACHIVGLSPTGFTVRVTANDVILTGTTVAIHWHAAVM